MSEPIRAVVRVRGEWFVANTFGMLGVSAVATTSSALTAALRVEVKKRLKLPTLADVPEILLLTPDGKPVFTDEELLSG